MSVWSAIVAALAHDCSPRMGGTGDGKPKRVEVDVMDAPMRRRKARLGDVGNFGALGVAGLKPPFIV